MKSRFGLLVLVGAAMLAGCNFTLAEDIAPPANYVPPTPMPTLGALFPSTPPDLQNGAAIFAERCAPCHGATGLGDGPQSMQLPVSVPAIGLPEGARDAAPAGWFKIVTQGNLDRFMPPFAGGLTDQERWDVVSYALTLQTTPQELERGSTLVAADCPDCAVTFADAERMSALSADDVVRLIRTGDAGIPAFAKDYSDEDAYAAAAHLRTLTLGAPAAAAVPPTNTAEAAPVDSTPRADGTPVALAEAPATGSGVVRGMIEFHGTAAADAMTITLHGFDHAADQTSGPQEVLTLSSAVEADGSYTFDNVEMPLSRIFLADLQYAGITYSSEFVAATADSTSIDLPALNVYEPSEDVSLLTLDQVHIYTDFATAGTVQVLQIFAFSNNSDRAVIISTDGITIPFMPAPVGATNQGYEAGQDSAPFVAANDGLAVVPSDKPYSIISFFNLPYERSMEYRQPLSIAAPSVLLLVPEGIKVEGAQFQSEGLQMIQNNTYMEYSAADVEAGEELSFTASGKPKQSSATGPDAQQGWLIGGGALGLALIVGGIYLYIRDRRRGSLLPEDSAFETTDEVLDAILALDDLHRAGKITAEAHAARRAELKDILKQLS